MDNTINCIGLRKSIVDKACIAILVGYLVVVLGVFYYQNASTGRLGTDEALYIFLAKGHYEATPLHAPMGTVFDAAKKGMIRTADPPGFFVLLHFWEKISFAEGWLRTLPYLLFIISIIALIRIALLCNLSLPISLLLGFLPLASFFMNLYAIELRGYGMEVTFIFLLIWSMLRIIKHYNSSKPISSVEISVMTLIVLVGLTTRFSYIITCIAAYGSIGILLLRDYKTPSFKKNLLKLSLSFSLIAFVFLIFMYIRYYAETKILINAASSGYYQYKISGSIFHIISYFLKQFLLVPQSFLGGCGLSRLGSLMYLLAGSIAFTGLYGVFLLINPNNRVSVLKKILQAPLFVGILGFPIISGIISIVLAVLGLHPFVLMSRWSLYLFPSFCLLFVGFIVLVMQAVGKKSKRGAIFKIAFAVIACVYGMLYMTIVVPFRGGGDHTTYTAVRNVISEQEMQEIGYWYISIGERSCFKFFYLYGSLNDKLNKNAIIIFENRRNLAITGDELDSTKSSMPSGSKIAMISSHINLTDAAQYRRQFSARFSDVTCGSLEQNEQMVCWGLRE